MAPYISEIKLKNFKSFKETTIILKEGFNAIVGPNGAGKSNITDAIRFCLGERKLSSLRVKNAKQLIYEKASYGKVKITLKNDEKIEIERGIKPDGKTFTKLNGKSIKRHELKHILLKQNIDNLDRIIISQGEVDKIALLKPKELRLFIEELAGIAEFERKKEEAKKELEIVEKRIRETNIALGEQLSIVEELEKEKEKLDRYKELKEREINLRYSLNYHLSKEIESKLNKLKEKLEEFEQKKKEIEKEITNIEDSLKNIDKERKEIEKYIEEKIKKDENYKKMVEIEKKLTAEKEKLSFLLEKRKEIANKIKEIKSSIKEGEEKLKTQQEMAKKIEKTIPKEKFQEKNKEEELTRNLKLLLTNYEQIKEERIAKESLLSSLKEKLKELTSLIEKDNIDSLRDRIKDIENELIAGFKEEEKLQKELAETEKEFLKTREEIAKLEVQTHSSKVYLFLKDIAEKLSIKVYGRVIDLIEFPPELSEAIEAAGGSRLTHIVVEDINSAKALIEVLKKNKLGTATFVPLKELKVKETEEEDAISNLIYTEEKFRKIAFYTFSDTLLVENVEEAKKYIGKRRVVTKDGILMEPSAALTGGKRKSSITAEKLLTSLKEKLSQLLEKKKEIEGRISEIRKEALKLREEKARIEEKIKNAPTKEELEKLKKEVAEKQKELEKLKKNEETLKEKIQLLEKKIYEERKKEKEKIQQQMEELSLKQKLDFIMEKINELTTLLESLYNKEKNLERELEKIDKEIQSKEDEIMLLEGSLYQLKEKEKELSKNMEEKMEKIKNIEKKAEELSIRKGKLEKERSKIEKEEFKIREELSTLNVKLNFIKAEIEKINGKLIEKPIHEIEEELKEVEAEISNLGEINFAVETMLEEMGSKIREVKEKIEVLKKEKEKIIELISHLEGKKRNVFKQTFEKVKENFEKLIEMLPSFGKATLYLTSNQFEKAGVGIKLYRNKEVPLESLSGGEKSLLSIMFIFALHTTSPSPIYVMDEVDAALDKINSKRLGEFIKEYSKKAQFIVISHNDITISYADNLIGVSKTKEGSKTLVMDLKALPSTS